VRRLRDEIQRIIALLRRQINRCIRRGTDTAPEVLDLRCSADLAAGECLSDAGNVDRVPARHARGAISSLPRLRTSPEQAADHIDWRPTAGPLRAEYAHGTM
jgi:hypothetical protein